MLELTEGFSLLCGVQSCNITFHNFQRQLYVIRSFIPILIRWGENSTAMYLYQEAPIHIGLLFALQRGRQQASKLPRSLFLRVLSQYSAVASSSTMQVENCFRFHSILFQVFIPSQSSHKKKNANLWG